MKYLKIIGFDADDTLWENGLYFRQAEEQLALLLKDYIQPDSLHEQLYAVEMKNMPHYGYGGMAYTLSLIETAIQVSRGKIGNEIIECILDLGRAILTHPIELLSDVQEVLPLLQERYRLIIVTRGEILDQERKLKKSGLLPFFSSYRNCLGKEPRQLPSFTPEFGYHARRIYDGWKFTQIRCSTGAEHWRTGCTRTFTGYLGPRRL